MASKKPKIVLRDTIKLKVDSKLRLAKKDELGADAHWSAKGFYNHICMLQELAPREVSTFEI